jgi:hypothetical protein
MRDTKVPILKKHAIDLLNQSDILIESWGWLILEAHTVEGVNVTYVFMDV